ncbi:MAG TPA: cell division protein FtsZ [Flavobacteriaceae bacterium]|nr:cell division protein FtsZ [Flavobacteriaceae bacterium]
MEDNLDLGITFDLPKNQSNVIKAIGIGGGGSNAINYMFNQGIKGVDFVICNTDAQALNNSGVPNKIQLGVNLTEGLGAGANPEVGSQSAIESTEDIKGMLNVNTKMVFITAGMGGGTGTGAAPVIAKMAREMDILTVGIVTTPFSFEGKIRNEQAQKGIENLREHVDSLIIINNNKLREVYGNLGFKAGFSKADEVLSTAAKGIAEVITHHYTQNIDLKDANTVLSNSGTAIMGAATASGDGRAQEAIRKALDSPLLNDNKITGAKNVLLLIVSGDQEITIDEIGDINDHIQEQAGFGANIIMGVGEDLNLGDSVSVTIIATGFNADQQNEIINIEPEKIIHSLEEDNLFNQKPIKNEISSKEIEEESEDKIIHVLNEEPVDGNDLEDEINETKSINDIEVIDFTHVVDEKENLIENEVVNEIDIDLIEEEETENSINWSLFDEDKKDNLSGKEKINEAIDVNEIEVIDYIELIPTEEKNEIGEVIHEMEDHMLFEPLSELSENSTLAENSDSIETEVETEVKEEIVSEIPTSDEEIDPLNTSIEDLQKQRSKERRLRMKEFNYKFNNSKIDEIEKVPAYKRQGVDLEETKHSSEEERSRFTLDLDENEDIQLRKNNSFLHDNVD